jgi:HEAT repeat protein
VNPKRQVLVALVALVLVALAVCILSSLEDPKKHGRVVNPVYKGKPASAWAKDQILNNSFEAAEAIKQTGADAVPFLIPFLHKRDSAFNAAYVKVWPCLPTLVRSRLPRAVLAKDVRMNAVAMLREMGPAAKAAVPELAERLKDKEGSIRLHSAIALGNIGPAAQAAVPAVKPFLRGSHTVRVYTANALWKIEHKAGEVLPILEAGLQEENAPFRWAAAVFLGEMGAAAAEAIPLLEKAVKSADKDTASCAVQALAEISPDTVPILIDTLGDSDAGMRISACVALRKIGPKAKQAVPALRALVEDRASGSPTIMGRLLGSERVGDAAKAALEQIDAALRD